MGAVDAGRFWPRITFNNPIDIDSLEGKISVSGFESDEIELFPSYDNRSIGIAVWVQPSTAYTVRLAAGATDREGQPLAPFSFSYTTGALRPSLNFAVPSQVATYSATTDPVLYFHAVNKEEAQFSLYRLTASQATRIVSEGQLPPGRSNLPWLPDQLPMRTWTEQLSPELDLDVDPTNVVYRREPGQPRRCRRAVGEHCSGRASAGAGAGRSALERYGRA